MNKPFNVISALLAGALVVGCLASGKTYAGNNKNAAKGKDTHRTWVVYQVEYPETESNFDFHVGDAFRLENKGSENNPKFKIKPLRKLKMRWQTAKDEFDLEKKGGSDTLLCGEISLKNGWYRRLAINTSADNVLELYWVDNANCTHMDSHAGHARAEN